MEDQMRTKRVKHAVTFRLWPESYDALKRLAAVQDATRNRVINRVILNIDANIQKMITGGDGDLENYMLNCMLPGEFAEAYRAYWLGKLAQSNKPAATATADSNGTAEAPAASAA
jgi:hypothetical protein